MLFLILAVAICTFKVCIFCTLSSRASIIDAISGDMGAYTRLTDSILHQIMANPVAAEVIYIYILQCVGVLCVCVCVCVCVWSLFMFYYKLKIIEEIELRGSVRSMKFIASAAKKSPEADVSLDMVRCILRGCMAVDIGSVCVMNVG